MFTIAFANQSDHFQLHLKTCYIHKTNFLVFLDCPKYFVSYSNQAYVKCDNENLVCFFNDDDDIVVQFAGTEMKLRPSRRLLVAKNDQKLQPRITKQILSTENFKNV